MELAMGLIVLALGVTLIIVGWRGTQAQTFGALTGHSLTAAVKHP